MTTSAGTPHPKCPLCESEGTCPRAEGRGDSPEAWKIRQCLNCKTSFVYPMPDPEALASYYDSDYYGAGDGKFVGPVEGIVKVFRYLRARTIRRFYHRAKRLRQLLAVGRVLDVGCGRGLMLRYLKGWGYEVAGVELDTVAAQRAGRNIGRKIFCSLEEAVQSSTQPYDVVSFWHSLEHMAEPGKTLETANRLIAPGGLLVISAPHMESLQSRLSGRHWLHLDLPRHLVHFDMTHLTLFLQKKGYQLIHKDHFSQEYHVIDSLCFLYMILGFDHLFPFNLIKDIKRHRDCKNLNPVKSVFGIVLLLPLTALAFLLSNLFSMLGSGSTATLFFRKPG